MKKQKYAKQAQFTKKQNAKEMPFSWGRFSITVLILFLVVLSVIIFTDKKEYFVGDQLNNHVQRKWRSFYRFTEKEHKNADILIFGNSHASAGIDPFIVSQCTGTNCFILNTPGAAINDMYFNLKEALRYTKPQVIIIETFCFYGDEMGEEWGRIQSFDAKKRNFHRLSDMFYLFKSDDWVKAWSPTIRNHSFLLTDAARIYYNVKNVGKEKNPDRMKLDLGRFLHGNNFMQDTTLAKYDSFGAPFICEDIVINNGNKKYLRKIIELCNKNGIKAMMLTVPMYYKTFTNYDFLKSIQDEEYSKYPEIRWLDLQQPYDSSLFTVEAFNNEYSSAMHTTSYGATVTSFKLADYLLKNYSDVLPDRSNDPLWIEDFKMMDYFVYCQDVASGMRDFYSILKNKQVGNFHIRELALQEGNDRNQLILKINKQADLPDRLTVQFGGSIQDENYLIPVQMESIEYIFPPQHKVYVVDIQKGVDISEIISITN